MTKPARTSARTSGGASVAASKAAKAANQAEKAERERIKAEKERLKRESDAIRLEKQQLRLAREREKLERDKAKQAEREEKAALKAAATKAADKSKSAEKTKERHAVDKGTNDRTRHSFCQFFGVAPPTSAKSTPPAAEPSTSEPAHAAAIVIAATASASASNNAAAVTSRCSDEHESALPIAAIVTQSASTSPSTIAATVVTPPTSTSTPLPAVAAAAVPAAPTAPVFVVEFLPLEPRAGTLLAARCRCHPPINQRTADYQPPSRRPRYHPRRAQLRPKFFHFVHRRTAEGDFYVNARPSELKFYEFAYDAGLLVHRSNPFHRYPSVDYEHDSDEEWRISDDDSDADGEPATDCESDDNAPVHDAENEEWSKDPLFDKKRIRYDGFAELDFMAPEDDEQSLEQAKRPIKGKLTKAKDSRGRQRIVLEAVVTGPYLPRQDGEQNYGSSVRKEFRALKSIRFHAGPYDKCTRPVHENESSGNGGAATILPTSPVTPSDPTSELSSALSLLPGSPAFTSASSVASGSSQSSPTSTVLPVKRRRSAAQKKLIPANNSESASQVAFTDVLLDSETEGEPTFKRFKAATDGGRLMDDADLTQTNDTLQMQDSGDSQPFAAPA